MPAWSSRERLALAFALVAAVLVVYAHTLRTPLGSDARFLTYQNEWVRSTSGLARFWTHDVFEGAETHGSVYTSGYYRPVLNTFFWLEYRWADHRDLLYNLMEVLLHGLDAFLVALLVTRVVRSRAAGLVAGALFALHPVQAFSATETAARADVLFTALYLGALLLFLRALDDRAEGTGSPVGRLAGVAGLYALALLSKEMAITLPAALVLLVLLRHAQTGAPLARWRWTIPAWGVFVAYLVWRFAILGLEPSSMGYGETHGRIELLVAALSTVPVQVGRILVPLGPGYPELIPELIVVVGRGLADPLTWAALGMVVLLVLALARWRQEPEIAFWAAFFVVAYSPLLRVDNILGTLDTDVILTQERWIYLPAVALFALAGLAAVRLQERASRRWLVPAAGVAVAAVLAWEAHVHAGKYQDPYALLLRLYAIPEQYLSRFEMANRYLLYATWVAVPAGDLAEAEERARSAVELVPDSPITAEALAGVVAQRGKWQEVREILTPWMYPTQEFLARNAASNVRVYDDWNRINPEVAFLLGQAQGHLGDPAGAGALLCDALVRGIPPSRVDDAAGELPDLSSPLRCE